MNMDAEEHLTPEQREMKRKVTLAALEMVLEERIPGFTDPVKLKACSECGADKGHYVKCSQVF